MNDIKGLGAPAARVTLALAVAALFQAGSALAALELRDINGHATAVAVDAEFAYDTVLDATWYLTGNNTGLNWPDAKSWASALTVGTFSGWSLPVADPACGRDAFNCTTSQMGELYFTVLGNIGYPNAGWGLSNTGPFKNLQSYDYWSGTEYAPDLFYAWRFNTSAGYEHPFAKYGDLYALAVRPGDVAAVPEPGTVALLLSGLAGVLVMRRRPVGS